MDFIPDSESYNSGNPIRMATFDFIWRRILATCAILVISIWANHNSCVKDVEIVIVNAARLTEGGKRFESVFGEDKGAFLLREASHFVQNHLYSYPQYPRKSLHKVVLSIDGNYTQPAIVEKTVIHISDGYLADFDGDLEEEIRGLVFREMGRLWLWDGGGEAPPHFINAMAEYIRKASGHSLSKNNKEGQGNGGLDGDVETMVMCLEYCEGVEDGFVADLNARLHEGWNNLDLVNYRNSMLLTATTATDCFKRAQMGSSQSR